MGSMFDPHAYGDEIAGILALDGSGERLMPLAGGTCSSVEARGLLKASRLRPAVLAGLYLYLSCWDEAHGVAQDLDTPEGSYWHALVHRQVPGVGRSGGWCRRGGRRPHGGTWGSGSRPVPHPPFFRARGAGAGKTGFAFGNTGDPLASIDSCN